MILKNYKRPLTIIFSFVFIFLTSACSSENSASSGTTKTVTPLPLAALTVPDPTGLSAYIILDGNTSSPVAMTIDTVAGTASASISGLSRASHTVQIEYRYNDGVRTYVLARSSVHTIDLSGGSASIGVPDTNYDTTFDDDNDGISNALEIAAGTNPNDSGCVLGVSFIGTCTL